MHLMFAVMQVMWDMAVAQQMQNNIIATRTRATAVVSGIWGSTTTTGMSDDASAVWEACCQLSEMHVEIVFQWSAHCSIR